MARPPIEAAPARSLQADDESSVLPACLMGRLGSENQGPWIWNGEEEGSGADLNALRQRLELVDLALRTSAPLSTAEVTHLLGARPGSAVVERGGLVARRSGRNVWKLSRSEQPKDQPSGSFQESWRRRL